ncbi:MAG TPA: hydroxymethylbilane synthase [Acidimicrobiales bacterium]|nr:hydroxymethylbilane synthase [Acidimicrobiales bacterium]
MLLRVATRGSALARWQADHVAGLLRAAHPGVEVELVIVDTVGDRVQGVPIWQIGGQGVFVKEVQAAVLDGRADLAVHSAKDLPSNPALAAEGLTIAAVPERGDPRDVLVGCRLDALAPGATVATGSTRRRAQLADARPDLTFAELRGNIATRLEKAAGFGAIVMAAAALQRLGLDDRVAEILEPSRMVPQVGQGALAAECRDDDARTLALLAAVEHRPSRRAVDAERGFLASLGGGCELPAGAYAADADDGALHLRCLLATLDGRVVLRDEVDIAADADAGAAGLALGRRLLEARGGRSLLDDGLDRSDGAVGS